MGLAEYSIFIQAAPDVVWSAYADPSRIPQWQTGSPTIRDLRGGPGEAGASYVSKRGPLSARTTVIESDPPRRLLTRTDAYLGLRFDVESRLVPSGDGTQLILRAETWWPRPLRPISKVVELAILSSREATKELRNLKTLLEQGAGAA
jgi:uncharacterized protein YndB with AHSA1/START domain